jgi:hypothetical protein
LQELELFDSLWRRYYHNLEENASINHTNDKK